MTDYPLSHLITKRGFDQFQDGLRSRFRAYRFEYKLTYCEPTDNPAMRLDFESTLHLGRATVWASGACDLEAVDIVTGAIAFSEHHQITNEREFHKVYSRLVQFMLNATNWPNYS